MTGESKSYKDNIYNDHFFSIDRNLEFNLNLMYKTCYAVGDLRNPFLSPKFGNFEKFCPCLF